MSRSKIFSGEMILELLNICSLFCGDRPFGQATFKTQGTDQAGLSFSELEKATGFPAATLRRQFGVLIEAGVIATSENATGARTYSLGHQSVNLSFVLVSLALDGRL